MKNPKKGISRATKKVASYFKKYQGSFRRIKSPRIPALQIVGFDTEDYEGQTVAYSFYDGRDYFYTKSFETAIGYIYNYSGPVVFVCHNLQYDMANLFKASKYRLVRDMTFASRLIKVTLQNVSPKRLYFMDSGSFFSGSLSQMGDLIGIPKKTGSPFDPEYSKEDARIPYVFMEKIRARLERDSIPLTLTLGSMAMADYRTNFMPVEKQRTFNSPLCLEAYYGGRVELFYKGTFEEKVFSADINSSYPNEMLRREFPETSHIEPSKLGTHAFGVGRFKILVPEVLFIPPLPFHSPEGRLFFPTGIIEGVWTYAEVRFALSKGCKILEEWEGEGTTTGCRPFVPFITETYQLRKDAKAKKKAKEAKGLPTHEEDFEILYYKLKMNNLYGKFSQHKDKTEMTRDKKTPQECAKLGEYVEGMVGPFYRYRVKRKKAPMTANYLWGTYVTSFARISLMEKLYAVHEAGGALLYCDTDSVIFAGAHALPALTVGGDLGQMSVEEFDMAHFEMAKGYLLARRLKSGAYRAVKLACKGVSQKYGLAYLKGESVSYEQPIRLKAGLITQSAKKNKDKGDDFMKENAENTWRMIEKTQRTIYFKRKGENGKTYPLDIGEIPALEAQDFTPETQKSNIKKGVVILPPRFRKEKFKKVKMPVGWEKAWFSEDDAAVETEYQRRGMDFLSMQRCLSLKVGDSWFSGTVYGRERTKYGKVVYLVGLVSYDACPCAKAGIVVAVPSWLFSDSVFPEHNEEFIGKQVEFILVKKYLAKYDGKKYTENTPLFLRGRILNQ